MMKENRYWEGWVKMICAVRKWELSDAGDLAAALSNKNILDNLLPLQSRQMTK